MNFSSPSGPEKSGRWYHSVPAVIGAILLLGPFAFPLLWKSPRFSLFWKWVVPIVTLILTVALIFGTWKTVEFFIAQMKSLGLTQ